MPVLFAIFVVLDVLMVVQWSRTFYLVYSSGGDFLFSGTFGFAAANWYALTTDVVIVVTSLLSIWFWRRGDVAWRVMALTAMAVTFVSALMSLGFSARFGMPWWGWVVTVGALVYPWFFVGKVRRGALG